MPAADKEAIADEYGPPQARLRQFLIADYRHVF